MSHTQTCDFTLIPRHLHVYDGRKSHDFANNSEWQHQYVVQNERYASSGDFVVIFFATESIVSVISPFLQLYRQLKMAARFFLHGDHLAKVVLSGTPLLRPVQYDRTFLRPVQYDRTFLDSVQYGNLLNVFTNTI